jgi:PKD repeat protein
MANNNKAFRVAYPSAPTAFRRSGPRRTLAALLLLSDTAVVQAATTFAIIGDYGMDNTAEGSVATLVKGWSPEFIVTTGDDYYSSAGNESGNRFHESTGKYYCEFLQAVAGTSTCLSGTATPTNRFFPVLGNHDYSDTSNGGMLPNVYTTYFTLPGSGISVGSVPSGNERYYDFVWGPVHFFMLNSGSQVSSNNCTTGEEPQGCNGSSAQAGWLQSALTASTASWKVVVLHKVPFSSDASHGSTTFMQWPYEAWGADFVVGGHSHTYERIIRDENGDGTTIPYIVNGLGGASRYSFGTPVAGSEVRYNGNWGAMRVTATDAQMTLEFYSIDNGGTLRDTYQLPVQSCVVGQDCEQIAFQNGVAPTASYAGNADTFLSQATAAINYGANPTLLVDGDDPPGSGNDLATLIRWDIDAIPAGSIIRSAAITLNVVNTSAGTYELYEARRGWDEGAATWNQAATGTPWQVAGAAGGLDRGSQTLGVVSASALGGHTLALNAAGVGVIQDWVDGARSNFGFILANAQTTDGADFDASETTAPTLRPKLTVVYEPPVGNQPPEAAFTATPATGLAPLTVSFDASSSSDSDGTLASYSWVFGDGTSGSGQIVNHTYAAAGNYTAILTVTDNDDLTASASRVITVTPGPITLILTSIGSEDGWVLESSETSNAGGSFSSSGTNSSALRVGDDRSDRQYKSIVSFDTSPIPDGANLQSAKLRLLRGSVTGTNPFTTHGALQADIQTGGLGGSTALATGDFQAGATATGVASLSNTSSNGAWSEGALNAQGLAAINKIGRTQVRLYFALDDNDDRGNDYLGYYSGENATAANRPQLVITYRP